MSPARIEEIVNAVLYEGYILYPYRASSTKNQRERFTFGRVYPESYSSAQKRAEPCAMQTECLVQARNRASISITVRFLQPMLRQIGEILEPVPEWNGCEPKFRLVPELRIENQLFQTWHEAVERRLDLPSVPLTRQANTERLQNIPFNFACERQVNPIPASAGKISGVIIRTQPAISGDVEISTEALEKDVFKLRVRVVNQTLLTDGELADPDAIMLKTFASTHTLLTVASGEFISSMDPGDAFRSAAASCRNIGTWPVLIGDEDTGERTSMLSSPIILYDYPKIAPESPGTLFDSTEIDEILSLRLQTLTDEEKFEMRYVDEHARRMLERTDVLSQREMQNMHGAMKKTSEQLQIDFDDFFGVNTRLESATVCGIKLRAGDRVRIHPKGRADVLDMAIAGQVGIIEAVEQDIEKHIHLAVVLENDPGKDLGMMRQPGHRFFYSLDEVEPLKVEA